MAADQISGAASLEAVERGGDKSWWDALAKWAGDTWEGIKNWFSQVWNMITAPFNKLKELVEGSGPFGEMVKGIGDKLAKDLGNWVREKLGLPKEEGYRRGTRHARPGWAWVGEEGPELVHFGGGEQVLTHDQSLQATRSVRIGTLNLQLPDWVNGFDDVVQFLQDFHLHEHYA